MTTTKKHDITWIAVLRIVACLLVVLAHACDPYVSGTSVEGFNAGAMWGTLARPSVPLFIMLSGVLLLPTSLRLTDFYKRRLNRILTPFIFWSIVSPWLFYILTQSIDTVSPTIEADSHTLISTIQASYMWIFNFSFSTIPYWYIYMMLGVYLFIPIISSWIKEATQSELKTLLYIWLFTTVIPYIQAAAPLLGYQGNYGSMGLYGECSWNLFTTFHYVSGFLGYVILAHYLVKYPLKWSLKESLIYGVIIWAIGYAITLYGFHFTRDNYPDNFNMLEIIWSFTSINVLMMTLPFFVIFQKINFKPSGLIAVWSEATYGIFLIHFVIVYLVFETIFQNFLFTPYIQIPTVGIIAFLLTSLVVVLLRKSALFRKLT
ncbi:MAG: acyltransferase [Rikenellaceae bacterium]